MGATIKDYYRELEIPFKSRTTHLVCGLVVKRDGRNSFVLTKNKNIIQTIIPADSAVGDMVRLLIINDVTKVISPEDYEKAYLILNELKQIEPIKKIEDGITVKKIRKKKCIDINW